MAAALGRLVDAGMPLLSQAVLLRGVNDRVEVLAELCERLVDLRVMPYYLHQLDRVAGAAHFEVPVSRGVELIANSAPGCPAMPFPATSARSRAGRTRRCWPERRSLAPNAGCLVGEAWYDRGRAAPILMAILSLAERHYLGETTRRDPQ